MSEKHKERWEWESQEGFDSEYEWQCERLKTTDGHTVLSLEDIYPGYAECGEHLVINVRPSDARLIAAAPELLEALKLAQLWLANSVQCCKIEGPKPLPVIAAAIAKATA